MKRPNVIALLLLFLLAGCAGPPPSGRTLVSVSWNNPGPHPLRHATVDFGKKSGVVYVEEVPAYSEEAMETSLALSVSPVARIRYRGAEGNVSQRFPVERPLRSDARDEYNLRIHVVGWDVIGVELEPASVARERLKNNGPVDSP